MKKQIFIATLPLLALAACGDSADVEEPAAPDPLAELAAGTGPYLVTYADGTQSLTFAREDGTEWGGAIEMAAGDEPVQWSVVDDQVCISFPEAMEDSEDFCMVSGELAEDGSWTVVPDNADEGTEPATMRRLDTAATSRADQMAAGTYWVDMPDGNSAMVYWGEDGNSYLAMNPTRSTWRADGNQRCTTPEGGEESCGSPTSEVGEDSSFTAEDGGQTITVRML
jgi:hypothetical protein